MKVICDLRGAQVWKRLNKNNTRTFFCQPFQGKTSVLRQIQVPAYEMSCKSEQYKYSWPSSGILPTDCRIQNVNFSWCVDVQLIWRHSFSYFYTTITLCKWLTTQILSICHSKCSLSVKGFKRFWSPCAELLSLVVLHLCQCKLAASQWS